MLPVSPACSQLTKVMYPMAALLHTHIIVLEQNLSQRKTVSEPQRDQRAERWRRLWAEMYRCVMRVSEKTVSQVSRGQWSFVQQMFAKRSLDETLLRLLRLKK